MTSWRTRIGVGLAVGVAAIAVPLTATAASAADWHIAGGETFASEQACEDQARKDYIDTGMYSEIDCVHRPDVSPKFYETWVR